MAQMSAKGRDFQGDFIDCLNPDLRTYTEVVCKNRAPNIKDRPDGLIVVRNGSREWRALVEAKVGSNELIPEQIEKY